MSANDAEAALIELSRLQREWFAKQGLPLPPNPKRK